MNQKKNGQGSDIPVLNLVPGCVSSAQTHVDKAAECGAGSHEWLALSFLHCHSALSAPVLCVRMEDSCGSQLNAN